MKIDNDPDGIHFNNGRYQISTNTFHALTNTKTTETRFANMYITQVINYDYAPSHPQDIKKFNDSMREIFQTEDAMRFMYALIGEAIRGVAIDEAVLNYGHGGSGKTTLLNVLRVVFGCYVQSMNHTVFAGDREFRMSFNHLPPHIRLILVDEISSFDKKAHSYLKMACSRSLTIRRAYGTDMKEIAVNGRIFMSSNKMVDFNDDSGLMRRIGVFHYSSKFFSDISLVDPAKHCYARKRCFDPEFIKRWPDASKRVAFNAIMEYIHAPVVRPECFIIASEMANFNDFVNKCLITDESSFILRKQMDSVVDAYFSLSGRRYTSETIATKLAELKIGLVGRNKYIGVSFNPEIMSQACFKSALEKEDPGRVYLPAGYELGDDDEMPFITSDSMDIASETEEMAHGVESVAVASDA